MGGTIKAYYKLYLASDLEGVRGAKDWEEDWLEHTTFVLSWGLMYVHLTYPNYPLCEGYGDFSYMKDAIDEDPAQTFVNKIKTHLPGFTPGAGSGTGTYGFNEYDYESRSQPSFDAMYSDLSGFWDTQAPPPALS